MPVLFSGGEEISLMLGLGSSFKRQCCAAAREMHDGKMLGVSLRCVIWVVRPGLGVCPLLAGEDGGQCLSLARRKRKGKVDLYPPVSEREDSFHSCSQSVGSSRRTKRRVTRVRSWQPALLQLCPQKGTVPVGLAAHGIIF